MASITLVLSNVKADTLAMVKPSGQGKENLKRLLNALHGVQSGKLGGLVSMNASATNAVAATATITSTGTATNAETMSLCNVTLTAKTSGAVAADGEFDISGTVATQATNIAAAINAATGLKGLVTASAALGVVTVTAQVPGVLGNAFQMSESLSNVTVTQFTGGTGGSSSTSSITLSRV
jgi:phage tail sheath gpL-like